MKQNRLGGNRSFITSYRILPKEDGVRKKIRIFPRTDPECVGKSMAYKNVHRVLQKLQRLHSIKEVESKQFSGVHRAKYYTITSKGLFYLIYFKRFFLRLESLIRYRNDVILDTILFPYFERDTFLRRYTTRFMFILAYYLGECCDLTLAAVKDMREQKDIDKRERRANLLMNELRYAAKTMVFLRYWVWMTLSVSDDSKNCLTRI